MMLVIMIAAIINAVCNVWSRIEIEIAKRNKRKAEGGLNG
jgi:hypothetical protein